MRMHPYKRHVFVCLGARCAAKGSLELLEDLKARIKRGELPGVRASRSGCLKVCRETDAVGEYSPAMVIYPEGVWYKTVTPRDVDEIVKRHIGKGEIVERLLFFKMKG